MAFAHFVRYGERIFGHFVGLDYDVSTRAALYFNTHYDLVRFAFDNDLKSVQLGITTYGPKTEMGFSVKPQVMYAWINSRMGLNIAAHLWNRANAVRPDKCHSAFKDKGYQHIWDGKTRQRKTSAVFRPRPPIKGSDP